MRNRLVAVLPLVASLWACGAADSSESAETPTDDAASTGTFGGRCMAGASTPKTIEGAGSCTVKSYAGRAQVVDLDVKAGVLLHLYADLADTGALPATGGTKGADLVEVKALDILTAHAATARTAGIDTETASTASVAGVKAGVLGIGITADTLGSVAHASCGSDPTGSSIIQGLKIAGASVTVTGAPNQTIQLALVKVVINEQVKSTNGSLTVNALHVSALGIDLVVGSSTAGIDCTCSATSSSSSSSGTSGSTSSSSGTSGSTSSSSGTSGDPETSSGGSSSGGSSSGGSSSGDSTTDIPKGKLGDDCDESQPCAEGFHCAGQASAVR